jgi:hypothetical protein
MYTPLPPRLWKPWNSSGTTGLWLEDGTVTVVTLPVDPGDYYGYSPTNGKILYSSHFPNSGGGPGNTAVSDLWMVDYPAGVPMPLIHRNTVVTALWTPDGFGFVYILTTPATYELRHRTLTGDDRLLASNVALRFSISPSGDKVAFTRESGYEVPGPPGLYVVPLAGGSEIMISKVDLQGAGSSYDQPIWSADGSRLALPNYAFKDSALVIAAADGSFDSTLAFAPEIDADPALLDLDPEDVLWMPDGEGLVVRAHWAGMDMTYSPRIVLYELADDGHTVISATLLSMSSSLVDWYIPGHSLYDRDENGNWTLTYLP